MIGYKGIVLKNGILRSKYDDIFEINVPRERQELNDNVAFTECGYSFCDSIEDVIKYENYIMSSKQRFYREVRLFQIETLDGMVLERSGHYKTSSIKVVREINQKKIIDYFSSKQNLIKKIKDYLFSNYKNFYIFEEYCNDKVEDYRMITDADKIQDLCIRSCVRLGQQDFCKQDLMSRILKYYKYIESDGNNLPLSPKSYEIDYFYLMARSKIKSKIQLGDIKEYNILKRYNKKYEIESLQRLSDFENKQQ